MLKILIVKSDETEPETPLDRLESRFQERAKFRRASDIETAFDYLDRGDIACIVLDLQLVDPDGREPFATLHEKHPTIPIIVLSTPRDEGRASSALLAGAAELLVKGVTTEEAVFGRIVSVLEKTQVHDAELLDSGRASPEASTKRPHQRYIPIDVVDSSDPPHTSTAPSLPPNPELPTIETPLDALNRRLDNLEHLTTGLARDLRCLTWIVGGAIATLVIWFLLQS
jgi:DNA-binding NarL/FixJ family response regulator